METAQVKLSKEEFQLVLGQFNGTEKYHLHRLPNGLTMHLTDGCAFVRENAGGGAYWLFDLILSWQMKLRKHDFQVWTLRKLDDGSWLIQCTDGNVDITL